MESRTAPNNQLTTPQRRAFDLAETAARRAVRRRFRVVRLTREAYSKIDRHESALRRVSRDLRSMIRLARAWAAKEYRDVPWKSVVYIVAAIVYFLNPADLIPDVLTGIGFVDDAAVIGAVVRTVTEDLAAFRGWERRRTDKGAAGTPALRELQPAPSAAA